MKRILSLLVMACLLAFTGACSSKKAPEPEKPHYNPSLAFGATWTRHPVILNGDTQDVLEVVVSSANPGSVVVTGIDINGRPISAAMPRTMEKDRSSRSSCPEIRRFRRLSCTPLTAIRR